MNVMMQKLVEKWSPMLEGLDTDEKVKTTAMMLENESRYIDKESGILNESGLYSLSSPTNLGVGGQGGSTSEVGDATGTPSGVARYKQIAIPMVRRIFPELLAHKLVGVQPMTGPVGLAYALRFRASTAAGNYAEGTELGYNNIDDSFSGSYDTRSGEQLNEQLPGDVANFGSAVPASTSREVGMTIEQKEIVARTRKLKARWTIEVEQDLGAMHNIDFEEEIMDLMAYEIAQEIDRELVGRIVNAALAGGRLTWNYGSVGIQTSGDPLQTADGRWQQEKFRTLYTTILNAAEEIARSTRMGPGNWVIVSPRVAVALQSLPDFQFAPVKGTVDALKFGVAEVGTLGNGMKVYRDTFAYSATPANALGEDYAVVGYKGGKESETGIIYCPYIPVMFQKAIGQESFSPRAGVMTRYGILDQLFGSQLFYRYIDIQGLSGLGSTGAATVPTTGNYAYDSGTNTVVGG
jgi:hypothetical protein